MTKRPGRVVFLGRLAQLVRAAGLQPAGRGFESLSAHCIVAGEMGLDAGTAQRRRLTQGSDEEGVTLHCTADGKGDGVLSTRSFAAGETVMVGFLVGALKENDSHATQVGPRRWARHGGLGPKVNHSCDPNCGVRLNDEQAFDVVARQQIDAGQEVTFDYAMRNFTIDHFPAVCLCGAPRCRGSVTGWKDLTAAQKAGYGNLVAPYLLTMVRSDRGLQASSALGGIRHAANRR